MFNNGLQRDQLLKRIDSLSIQKQYYETEYAVLTDQYMNGDITESVGKKQRAIQRLIRVCDKEILRCNRLLISLC